MAPDSGTSAALAAPSWLARRLAEQLAPGESAESCWEMPRLGFRLEDSDFASAGGTGILRVQQLVTGVYPCLEFRVTIRRMTSSWITLEFSSRSIFGSSQFWVSGVGPYFLGFQESDLLLELEASDYAQVHEDCELQLMAVDVPAPHGPLILLGDPFLRLEPFLRT